MKASIRSALAIFAAIATLLVPAVALAATTPTLNQTVNDGALTADILQSDDNTPVASPTVGFTALNRSFSCQTNTATLGDTDNRIYVTNFDDVTTGFHVTMAASSPTATWTDTTHSYDFNDPTGSTAGCTNGQLTVDASGADVTLNCNSACNAASITKGTSTGFNQGTTDAVTLFTNASTEAWRGYITGIDLSQKIPASQEAGVYSLGMTITAAAY
jgi:hypothetical protein